MINLICHYSDNSGRQWHLASVSGTTANISQAGYTGSIIWRSNTDLPGVDKTTVRFKITPNDGHTGTALATNNFHLDNNLPPSIQIGPIASPQSANIALPISIQDAEQDTIYIMGKYSKDSAAWEEMRFSVLPEQTKNNYTDTLYWKSLLDLGIGRHEEIRIQLYPSDNDSGTYSTSNAFNVDNKTGDYTGDFKIDSEDLPIFALAWRQQDLSKEIGPADPLTFPPYLIPQPDGKIDFEDLMVLAQQWNDTYNDPQLPKKINTADSRSRAVQTNLRFKMDQKSTVLSDKSNLVPEKNEPVTLQNLHLIQLEQSNYDQWANELGDELSFRFDSSATILGLQVEIHYGASSFSFTNVENEILKEQNGLTFERNDTEEGYYCLNTFVLNENQPDPLSGELLRFKIQASKKATSSLTYQWIIYADDGRILTEGFDIFDMDIHLTTPTHYALYQNFPNPFNPRTTIRYQLPIDGKVKLDIFNILGERVTEIINQKQPAGYYNQTWDITNHPQGIASGIYFVRLLVEGNDGSRYVNHKKLVLLK
jgi:hypothetical protein